MIEIKKDPTRSMAKLPSGALLLQTTSEYPKMCMELRSALQEAYSLVVVVQNPLVCDWVDNVARCYPEITVTQIDPLQELRDRLGITSLPPDLTPQGVGELGLLSLPAPTEPVHDAKSWILSQLVGECWGSEEPDPDWQHLANLASWYAGETARAIPDGLIQRWMTERHGGWVGNRETYLQKAYDWLLTEPSSRSRLLLCRQILLPYGDRQQQDWIRAALGCEHFVPDYVPIQKLPKISRERSLVAELGKRAKAYWRSQIPNTVEIEDALSHMSGELFGELEAVAKELELKPEKCSRELVLRVRHRFRSLEGVSLLLDRTEALIPPLRPQQPQRGWNWDQWALWATQEYLPYREWVHVQKRKDSELDRYALMYGDWLYEQYPLLKNASEPLVFGVAWRIRQLIDEGYVVLWVVIDNLRWMHGLRLVDEMAKRGLVAWRNPDVMLSMLPSETATSKRALLGGRLPRDLDANADYNQLLWARWGSVMRYVKNQPSLHGLVSKDAKLYVYQYDELDPIAHRFEVNRQSTVQSKLQLLATATAQAVELLRARFDRIIVMVDSDHGSARIPKSADGLKRPPSASSETNRHRRFVVLNEDTDLCREDWYVLKPAQFGTREIFAVARGYAYVEKRPQYYTHGGLTPEETIVPHIEFEPGAGPKWVPLEVVYEGEPIRPGRSRKATFEIKNLNATRLSDVRLLVQGTESGPITIDTERHGQIQNVSISIPPSVREPQFSQRAYVAYLAYGSRNSQEVHIGIPVRLIAVDSDMSEIFEE